MCGEELRTRYSKFSYPIDKQAVDLCRVNTAPLHRKTFAWSWALMLLKSFYIIQFMKIL